MNEPSMSEIMNEIIPMVTGNDILDIGTGFGIVIKALINNKDINITSIDPEMWRFDELKNTFLNEIYEGRLKLLKTSIEEINSPDNRFSTSISLFSAHHFSNTLKAINKIENVTSGTIIIADWSPASSGISNPHSSEELEKSMSTVKNYALKNKYKIQNNKMWFMIYKTK